MVIRLVIFLTDRYIATGKCATNPRFQQLYLNDNELMKSGHSGYVDRFTRLRALLGCNGQQAISLCDETAIKRAIDRYPSRDIWGSELFQIPIRQLAEEFGENAFNVGYLEHMYDNLQMTRRGEPEGEITLRGIIVHALRKYKEAEKEAAKTPEQIRIESGDHWFQPSWNLEWGYMKCLLRIFQKDPRTRTELERMVTDAELEI